MKHITIYLKPTCSTCRQVLQFIKDSGIPFTAVNYYESRFTKARLKTLLKMAGLGPKEALRTKEGAYKKLMRSKNPLTDDEILDAMVSQPDLIQRPLVETDGTALLARPADTVKQLL